MMNLSLATRIFLGYAGVLFAFGAVSIFSILDLHESRAELQLLTEGYLELQEKVSEMANQHKNVRTATERLNDRFDANREQEATRSWVNSIEIDFGTRMAQLISDATERIRALPEIAPASALPALAELSQRLKLLDTAYARYAAQFTDVAARVRVPKEAFDPVAVNSALDELVDQGQRLTGHIDGLKTELTRQVATRTKRVTERSGRTHVTIIGLSLLAIIVGLIATAISARSLSPVRTLTEAVKRIGTGDYSAQLNIRGADEIAQLARAFDGMARSLREREAQLKEQQEALLRAEQLAAVGRVSAQIAHEVRNPLSSIGLNIELLEEAFQKAQFGGDQEAREAREILASVIREVDRLTEVTEHYLRMARLPKPSLAAEDLNGVVEGVLDFSREELERSRVQVVRRLDPQGPRAMADEGQLRQVFLNLLRNSREAMHGGGKLTVESRQQNGHVEVVFQDTGRGMTPEVQQRIFEPFFSTKDNGTGLGLAVSRQILQAHGGTIDCQSAPGAGTTFIVRLPRA